jgi:hypothetical protein
LRQQLAILYRNAKKPKLRSYDRLFWVHFIECMEELAFYFAYRKTGYCCSMAS